MANSQEFTLLLAPKARSVLGLQQLLKHFQGSSEEVHLKHIESRPIVEGGDVSTCNEDGYLLEYIIIAECSRACIDRITRCIQDQGCCYSVQVTGTRQDPWFPKTVGDLVRCVTAIHKYGAEPYPEHPGFTDDNYWKKRASIAEIVSNHKIGDPIPQIDYNENEIGTWRAIYVHQSEFYPTHACREHNRGLQLLEQHCGYCKDQIPQVENVSQFLESQTGFRLCPVSGWISSRDFLNILAFRFFPCTQYIRHHSQPFYSTVPDIVHELLGHVPLFLDPSFADFSQQIGLASLGASEEWIKKLSTLYWFTVEFGLVYEDGKPKAYGAGLLSSCKEIESCLTDKPEKRPFTCSDAVTQWYPEEGLQPLLFVANSLHDVKEKMVEFTRTIPKSFSVSYDRSTRTIITT